MEEIDHVSFKLGNQDSKPQLVENYDCYKELWQIEAELEQIQTKAFKSLSSYSWKHLSSPLVALIVIQPKRKTLKFGTKEAIRKLGAPKEVEEVKDMFLEKNFKKKWKNLERERREREIKEFSNANLLLYQLRERKDLVRITTLT